MVSVSPDVDRKGPLQQSPLATAPLLPRARRPAQPGAADSRRGRDQDEQKPRQRDRAGGERGRNGPADPKAKTDAERDITYEPDRRPDVSNLVLLAALCLERPPEDLAADLGGAGAAV